MYVHTYIIIMWSYDVLTFIYIRYDKVEVKKATLCFYSFIEKQHIVNKLCIS